jgi:hypothetical protein
MHMKYSYLACGPRLKCGSCGKIEWSQVKQSSDEGIGWVPYSWRQTEPIPVSWSLHCGGPCSNNTWTTTVFEKLENPFLRNLTQKNRVRYEYNRKKIVSWLLAGWPETEERIRTNRLLYVPKVAYPVVPGSSRCGIGDRLSRREVRRRIIPWQRRGLSTNFS